MLPCCLLEALQNATSSRHGLEDTGIAQRGVWLMWLARGIAKPNVWRMWLASHIAKCDGWQMLLSGSIVKRGVCRMWPARNIAKGCVRHMWVAAAIRIFALCAQPGHNSRPIQQTGRSMTSKATDATSHAATPENRQPLQNVVFYSLQTTLQNVVFGQMQLAGNIAKRWVWRS